MEPLHMKGAQDLGGLPGFGPINPEKDEPIFHAAWERRVLGFTVAMGAAGAWTGDQSRHQREKLPKEFYWHRSYYEIWLEGLGQLLHDRGMVTDKDIAAGHMVDTPKPVKRVLRKADVAPVLAKGFPYDRPTTQTPQHSVGQTVRTIRGDTPGHSRLPAYAWQKQGTVEAVRGCHVYPDSNGMGQGEDPRWLYTVRFTSTELWSKPGPDSVCLDLWEPYLEPA